MRFAQRSAVVVAIAAVIGVAATGGSFTAGQGGPTPSPSSSTSPTGSPEPRRDPAVNRGNEPRWLTSACTLQPELLRRTIRGYYPDRSPELTFVPKAPDYFGTFRDTTTHSGPWPYVQRVPLVFYGPGFIRDQGSIQVDREVTLADIAPTMAELLRTPFPTKRPGKVLNSALLPRSERNGKPRLILTMVWDGGGINTLEEWPGTWPNLRRAIDGGTAITGATVGSNPSVTPAIHANIGTGSFPSKHGIVSIPQRKGAVIADSWADHSPKNLLMRTLADIYDPRTDNRAKIGLVAEQDWHLGMMGKGAMAPGGDKDIGVLTRTNPFETNPAYYRLPEYMQRVPGFQADLKTIDASDGNVNGKWLGHDLPADRGSGFANPVWSLYQMRLLRTLLTREGFGKDKIPDLFFTNFKQIDEVSHAYFLQSPEMKATIPYSDKALGGLIRWMDNNVGKNRWVLAMTADHGVGPKFKVVGAWPINMEQLLVDVAVRFRVRVTDLFQSQRPQGFWLNMEAMRRAGITLAEMSSFLLNYKLEDNLKNGQRIPQQYRDRRDEPLFDAVFPSDKVTGMSVCKDRG